MASLDQIIDRVCDAAGADFAFVLTRRGRLATTKAPQDMPEAGRMELVSVAESILAQRASMRVREMPRQALVPYGGAAPIDVYVAAREEAILCVVMATYISKDKVSAAVAQGLVELDGLLEDEGGKRARRRKAKPAAAAKSSTGGRTRKTLSPPALDFDDGGPERGTVPFLTPLKPGRRGTPPPPPPEITLGEASLGRGSLAAIEVDRDAPEITYGMAPIGRATVAEIELSMLPKVDPRTSIPDVRVELASMPQIDVTELELTDRMTLPFTETAQDSKRAFEASERPVILSDTGKRQVFAGRSKPFARVQPGGGASGQATAKASPGAESDKAPAGKSSRGTMRPEAQKSQSPGSPFRDSNIELWHKALGDLPEPEAPRKTPVPRPSRPGGTSTAAAKRKSIAPPPATKTSRPPKGK